MSGSPPTERNARTGLFTPPTSSFSARAKISRERYRSRRRVVFVAFMTRENEFTTEDAEDTESRPMWRMICGIFARLVKNGRCVVDPSAESHCFTWQWLFLRVQ